MKNNWKWNDSAVKKCKENAQGSNKKRTAKKNTKRKRNRSAKNMNARKNWNARKKMKT